MKLEKGEKERTKIEGSYKEGKTMENQWRKNWKEHGRNILGKKEK